ncbi:DUF2637 domain-containing protein [Streptomyces canus]|uniref:DUF2637 domain-containing protein n=1 Tax=Streptomyces canus TaxID=58343 RepID=UPI00225021A1|nr:DUF2637 domain-containing protein [Streptomyces canus]MCX4858377.1 DUF2637 domain-containing protein [Streptomyces canus]
MPDPYRIAPAAAGRTRLTRVLVTAIFLAAVAAFESVGFRLSYEALHRVAVDNAVPEHSAWMFPVLVDGGIVLGSVGVVRALAGKRSTRPYWTVTVAFTLVSWGFNVSNAPDTAGGWAVATVAPLAQMVALEMGMQELRALLLQSEAAAPSAPALAEAAPAEATAAAQDSTSQQSEQQPDGEAQQPEQQDKPAADDAQQRQQRQRPPLQPDTSRRWAELYEECSTEEARIALTREALSDRPKLTAPQWAVDIGKGETRARDLLRAARKPPTDAESQAQLELLSA